MAGALEIGLLEVVAFSLTLGENTPAAKLCITRSKVNVLEHNVAAAIDKICERKQSTYIICD